MKYQNLQKNKFNKLSIIFLKILRKYYFLNLIPKHKNANKT